MSNRFASNKRALAMCDVCGFEYRLKQLKNLVVKGTETQIKACPECWNPDQPQLMLGTFPVDDPQALRNPRPDTTYVTSGTLADGSSGEGSRTIQWGWNPVGGASSFDAVLTPNSLVAVGQLGSVTVA